MGMFAIREMGSGGGGVGVAVELAEPLAMVALLGCFMLMRLTPAVVGGSFCGDKLGGIRCGRM